ncbi:MAG TPA: Rrf2 family transcriptional regulator [Terracidiphilus sp.]|nr:Rrf2 family transcriptional regulator [Terracidiphilus sp.]
MKRTNSSMQLTRAADYAVRVMIQLAVLPADERVSLPLLARETDAPESFLSKVLQSLTRAGLIVSQRGQTGGFSITARGRVASMREVVEAIDGEICLNVCLMHGKSCPRKARCPAHPVWARAQQAMLQVLSGATIASMSGASREKPGRLTDDDVRYLPVNAVARRSAGGKRREELVFAKSASTVFQSRH